MDYNAIASEKSDKHLMEWYQMLVEGDLLNASAAITDFYEMVDAIECEFDNRGIDYNPMFRSIETDKDDLHE